MLQRILIFTHDFSPHTETFIYNDALALQREVKVKIVCLRRQNQQLRPFDDVEVIPYTRSWMSTKFHNLMYKLNLQLTFKNRLFRGQLQGLLNDFQPDVLHLHFGIQALYFLDNLNFLGPIFITFHGYDATKLVKKSTIYRKRLQQLFKVENIYPLATSASLFDYMSQYEIRSPRSRVLYSGIDIEFFKPTSTTLLYRPFTFTQISSFRSKKGHGFLLQAIRELIQKKPEKKIQLILAGGGDLEKEIKDLTVALGLSEVVQFTGWITPEQAVDLLRMTHVFVHPSITTPDGDMESTTVAILEAMAMELPVFATVHSGIPEIVEHGVNGLLAKEKDVEDYVNCLEQLMHWGKLPQNRQKIKEHFNHKKHLDTLLEYYRQAQLEVS